MADETRTIAGQPERLEGAQEILDLVLENVKDYAIVVLDPEGRIATWNGGAERLLGYCAEDIVGQPSAVIFRPEDQDAAERELRQAATSGRAHDEGWRVRKDGSRFWASGVLTALRDHSGALRGFVKILRDHTEQKEAADAAAHLAREAESASRAKDEFMATVSHELRTPLNAMLGWAHMLEQGTLDPATTRKALQTIVRNANNQSRLINDLLDMARIISGQLRLDIQECELIPVIEAAIETVQLSAEAKRIHIERALDPHAQPVLGDPARMQQVIWNLLSNAIKFTPEGGRIDVRLERRDRHVSIVVADNGRGISPALLPHVFDRFRRGDVGSGKAPGLGLGLAIVRHIVELHGGTVEAESAGEGAGASFQVTIPWWNPKDVEPVSSAEGRAHFDLKGMRVLLVEDDADTRELLSAMLVQFGARVRAVATTEDALAAIDEGVADVLVSDIRLPESNDYDLIRAVRARPPERGGALPAVAVTALTRSEDHRRALDAGYHVHVPKPVTPAKLVAVLGFLLRQGSAL
jgi:PAS domain S-box-containing protein